jgi:ABC-type lipoprotein export system ATPase subunit
MRSTHDTDPLIETRGLTRYYRVGPSTVRALDGVDLEVRRGELLAVLGVSGSGKSTLLHLLGGLDTPTSGTVRVEGRDLARFGSYQRTVYRRTTVGLVFQSYYLVPSLTAQQNVALALTFQGTFGPERRQRAAEAIRRVGLAERAGHRPGQLSGGEQQRVALARAIVHTPPLLLADEPTGNLDRTTAARIAQLLLDLQKQDQMMLIVVTHSDRLAALMSRQLELDEGRLKGNAE